MTDSLQRRWRTLRAHDPRARALGWYDRRRTVTWLDRDELAQRSEAIAAGLVDRGLRPGDTCVVVRPSDLDTCLLVVAVHLVGAVPLLVAPPSILGENGNLGDVVTDVVARVRPRLVVAADDVVLRPEALRGGVVVVREPGIALATTPDDAPDHLPVPDAVGGLQLTSGTTGFPRICVWTQRSLLAAIDGMGRAMDVTSEDRCCNWTPLYHDMGLVNNLLTCLTLGIPLVMLSPHDFVRRPALWLQAMSDTRTTVSWSPNFGFALASARVRDPELADVDLSHVRAIWNAAERIHHGTITAFEDRYAGHGLVPGTVRTNFGCAENVGGATFSDPHGDVTVEQVDTEILQERHEALVVPPGHPRATTVVGVGRGHPALRVLVLDPDGLPLPDGHVGEVALRTPSAMDGYLGDPDATSTALVDGLLRTGDLGYLRDGELFWTGRVKERITVRGRKLDPSDFEAALLGVPGVRAGCFAAFGVDDAERGTERLVVVSEVREPMGDDGTDLAGRIRHEVAGRLGVAVDEVLLVRAGTLTKTSSGKRRHTHFRTVHERGGLDPFLVSRHV